LVRPNLAPVAICAAIWCAVGGRRRLIAFALAGAPFVIVLLAFNAVLYGHPLRTGYGDVGTLFRLTHIPANVENYGRALVVTQLGFPLVGLVAAVWAPKSQRKLVWLLTSAAVTVMVIYLLYRPLPEWWYLRFMLPALPVLVALAIAVVTFASRRPSVAIPVAVVVMAYATTSPPMREALNVSHLERRFRLAGGVAREQLPQNSVFLTVWESGTVRFHSAREAVVWDSLGPGDLDTAVHWLRTQGREPFIMIEDWEEPLFRERFGERSTAGQLDWPPRFDIDRRVKIFSLADRERFLAGEHIVTQYVRPNRR
jgi:hypothetical protein